MLPHLPTLTLATLAVSAVLSVLLFGIWLQQRSERALLYWGAAGLAGSLGLALLIFDATEARLGGHIVSHALFILWAGLTWCGVRSFGGRRPLPEWVAAATLGWLALGQSETIANDPALWVALLSGLRAIFIILAIVELVRGRHERLVSRWPVIGLLSLHVAALLSRIPVVLLVGLPAQPELFRSGWFSAVALGQLLYTTAIAFMLLAMAKERAEQRYKRAARTDSLTALLNRRAFMEEGDACLGGQAAMPVAALVFDLDEFKGVNDRFGHAAGDRVLKRFAATLRAELSGAELAARLGGEEFAALLPGCDQPTALARAERIRRNFAAGAALGRGRAAPTVSAGVAIASQAQELSDLLAQADRAAYRAKHAGRNCVRLAGTMPLDEVERTSAPSFAA